MSKLNEFKLFPLLTLELRLLIWTHALETRVITLESEGYGENEDPTAIPFYEIRGVRPPSPEDHAIRDMWSGRFIPSTIPSQALFQVSQEPRNQAFLVGYRTWKMQKRGGLVRNIIWNPAKDFILFARQTLDEPLGSGQSFVHPHHWLRMFHVQFPTEISLAQNVAMHTSLWFRLKLERNWVVYQLLKFQNMRRLVMVIDERYERQKVTGLAARGLAQERWGPWKLPHAIIETLQRIKNHNPRVLFELPDVRLVEDVGAILTSPGIEATLQCNPCKDLGME
jgi:hypothetical protein